ncbi:MAG TPA: MFS transporter, partial [Candidatus Dormibacteraeota bacterium]|nr:MFS transporter [Candidatus Dormibacteraeota bacterium]
MAGGSSRVFYGWVLVWALGITTIVSYGTTQYLFGVLLVPIQHETGWSRGGLSGAYSLSFVAVGVLGVPIGRLVD